MQDSSQMENLYRILETKYLLLPATSLRMFRLAISVWMLKQLAILSLQILLISYLHLIILNITNLYQISLIIPSLQTLSLTNIQSSIHNLLVSNHLNQINQINSSNNRFNNKRSKQIPTLSIQSVLHNSEDMLATRSQSSMKVLLSVLIQKIPRNQK